MPGDKTPGLDFIPLIFLFLIFVSVACDDTVCSDLGTSKVIITFNDLQSKGPKPIILDSIVASGLDSAFFAGDTLTSCALPVNSTIDSTIFYFYNSGKIDTLVIRYHRSLKILSKNCGYSAVYDQVSAGYTTFPEVISKFNALSLVNDSNIKIYF